MKKYPKRYLSTHVDKTRGNLVSMEFGGLPFIPKRMFYVHGVPPLKQRGDHAHKECVQCLVCVKGCITVTLHDGSGPVQILLKEGESVYVEKMVWAKQYYTGKDSVLLVLCSHKYDKEDYITDWNEFLKMKLKAI